MATDVSICNQALGWLGSSLINSLDDDSTQADLCRVNYPVLRDAVLEGSNWTFAMARTQLSEAADAPEFGWSHQYKLPNDCLRVVRVFNSAGIDVKKAGIEHVREGDYILTNYADTMYISYVSRVEDENKFSPGFVQALAARIASDLAIPLTRNPKLQQDMWALYTDKLKRAAFEMSQGTQEVLRADRLANARRQYNPDYSPNMG